MKPTQETEAEIRAFVEGYKPKHKKKRARIYFNTHNNLKGEGVLLSDLMKQLINYRDKAAAELGVSKSHIRVFKDNCSWNSNIIRFYSICLETDDELKKRKDRSLHVRLANLEKKNRIAAKQQKDDMERRKKQLTKLVNEFGDEIYDVFKEITNNK